MQLANCYLELTQLVGQQILSSIATLVLTERLLAEDEVACLSYCNHPPHPPTHNHTALFVLGHEGKTKLQVHP